MTAPDPGRTAYEALAERLRAWGENDADPAYFQGDVLSCALLDCGAASEAVTKLLAENERLHEQNSTLDIMGETGFECMMRAGEERDELRARFARLLIAFHDAIRRPLGVTPDSGAEFYDPRMADKAEARPAQGGRL
ncbi:hypothetical protein ABIE45_004590 [Methylobacterium sp. OAE515]|uniref:hypothetical protein n=1 Tax=Methylobacterium sp. OAE515 TaxID=2817895 RepID=UPI00178B7085